MLTPLLLFNISLAAMLVVALVEFHEGERVKAGGVKVKRLVTEGKGKNAQLFGGREGHLGYSLSRRRGMS